MKRNNKIEKRSILNDFYITVKDFTQIHTNEQLININETFWKITIKKPFLKTERVLTLRLRSG